MNELKFLIVEDNPITAEDLANQLNGLGCTFCKIVDNSKAAIQYVDADQVDIVILNILIEATLKGMELTAHLKKKKLPVLFVASSENLTIFQQADRSYPNSYLVNPFKRNTLQKAIQTALQMDGFNGKVALPTSSVGQATLLEDAFFIKQNNLLRKIPFESVLWIKTEGNYSLIHTKEKRYILKLSLKKVLKQLPSHYFLQVQRAFIVALPKIEDIDISTSEIIIQKERLPLGRNYRDALLSRLKILK